MKNLLNQNAIRDSKRQIKAALYAVLFATVLVSPELMAAAAGGTFTCAQAGTNIKSFFETINGILAVISLVIVTIAIVFAGYQIAFAHKRISDVAPVLIGAFLVGGAAAIASMLVSGGTTTGAGGGTGGC
jgi:type IV secretion system protein VirB2